MVDGETKGKSEEEIHQLSEELHGAPTLATVREEAEEVWKRVADKMDRALSLLARAKIEMLDLQTKLN